MLPNVEIAFSRTPMDAFDLMNRRYREGYIVRKRKRFAKFI